MTRLASRATIAARVAAAAAVLCVSVTPYSSSAAPTLPRYRRAPAVVTAARGAVGADIVSLETSAPSIPAGGVFRYSARVALTSPADYVSVRFRAKHPSGRLIFQRTRITTGAEKGAVTAFFERGTEDLDLRPGVFPVELEVTIARAGRTESGTFAGGLFVYDATRPPLTTAAVVRINGQPLSDPNGRFVADPGRFTRARDDARAIAEWVLGDERVRVTVAIPPILVEEWRRIADGYEFAGPEGVEQVPAEAEVAQRYGATVRIVENALATGRMELASLGYSDPDLSDLNDAGLLDDVTPQYERGLSTIFASLETSPSTGTVPAGGCVPARAAAPLAGAGVRYVVLDPECTRSGDTTALPSAYRAAGGLVALVADAAVSAAARSGDTSLTSALAFARLIDEEASGPLVLTAELGAGGTGADDFISAFDSLSLAPWVRRALARDVAARPRRSVSLRAGTGNEGDPAGYWDEVRMARRAAEALLAAAGEGDADAGTAQRDSLIAQCSAWAGPDGAWALADRGRSFAGTARRLADDVLKGVSLAVQPITLAGQDGDVPVTIRNATDRTLSVRVDARSTGGVRVTGPASRVLRLEPKETLVEIPVNLSNALTGRLSVSVSAGDVVLDEASVTLRTSYLDRIVTGIGVVTLLGILLAIIIRRVRDEERRANAEGAGEAYTGRAGARRAGRRR